MKLPVLELQTLAIRFATVDNAEAFKAAFLEARQYVLENQVDIKGLAFKNIMCSSRQERLVKKREEKLMVKRLQTLTRLPKRRRIRWRMRWRRRWRRSNLMGKERRLRQRRILLCQRLQTLLYRVVGPKAALS